jgi:MFS family permease
MPSASEGPRSALLTRVLALPFGQTLRHRDFRYYALGRFLATFALQMQNLAVGFQVYALTHRKIDLAYIGLVQFLPIASLSIPGGQLADRRDRRRILLVCDGVFGVAALSLWRLARTPSPSFGAILALLLVSGAGRAFYGPAGSSLLPSLVPREQLANAVSVHSTLWQIAAIGGPSVAGAIYAAGGASPVYLTTIALFACGGVFLAGIGPHHDKSERPPATVTMGGDPPYPPPQAPVPERRAVTFETALAGVRYVKDHTLLLGVMSLDFLAVFLGGATALLPVYATDILHVGPRELGVMRSAPAIGAGIMAACLALRPLGGRAGVKMLAGVGLFGAATVVFGLSTSFPLTLAMLALLGAADMVSVVVRGTVIQAATPSEVRGRVSAVNLMFVGASNELGEFESGLLAEWLGTVPSVVFGGLGTLAVVLLWAWGFPGLARVDRLEDVTPEPLLATSSDGALEAAGGDEEEG